MSDEVHAYWAQVVAAVLIVGLLASCAMVQSHEARLTAQAKSAACAETPQ